MNTGEKYSNHIHLTTCFTMNEKHTDLEFSYKIIYDPYQTFCVREKTVSAPHYIDQNYATTILHL